MNRIYYAKPSITAKEVEYATDAARNGWGPACYEYITRFEQAFKSHLGAKYAVATSSGTGALHLGMAALGIGPGDEVIMADTNWIATAAPVVHLGARPVFVDILPNTWCIDPDLAEAAITPRTKAIVAVHLYGNLCDMDKLLDVSQRRRVPIIEDAAEAIGSVYHNKRAGSMGIFGGFSFHGTKTMTTGEGGMFVTNDDSLYQTVLMLANHGRRPGQIKQFWAEAVGYKYKISNIQAAIGCAQMERVEELIARKREILEYYRKQLEVLPGVKVNPEYPDTINGAWMSTAVFDQDTGVTREELQKRFAALNIDARVFFWPLSSLPMFEPRECNRYSYDIPKRAINLPCYHDLSPEQLDIICGVIKSFFTTNDQPESRVSKTR